MSPRRTARRKPAEPRRLGGLTPRRSPGVALAAVLAMVLAVSPTPASPAGTTDAEVLAAAERAFTEGAELRDDEARARPAFARAAAGYDELWHRGVRNPDLARNRANAHRLAGDLPRAIAALHAGLAVARWDRSLQVALEDARSAVGYPLVGDLAAECRPRPVPTVGARMSPAEAWLIAGLLWAGACGAVARFAMTRRPGWVLFAAAGVAALAALGWVWLADLRQRQREDQHPLVIVAADVTLRKGNAAEYPARLAANLPPGVEARELARRGGWVQIRLAGGAVGWVPAGAVLAE